MRGVRAACVPVSFMAVHAKKASADNFTDRGRVVSSRRGTFGHGNVCDGTFLRSLECVCGVRRMLLAGVAE